MAVSSISLFDKLSVLPVFQQANGVYKIVYNIAKCIDELVKRNTLNKDFKQQYEFCQKQINHKPPVVDSQPSPTPYNEIVQPGNGIAIYAIFSPHWRENHIQNEREQEEQVDYQEIQNKLIVNHEKDLKANQKNLDQRIKGIGEGILSLIPIAGSVYYGVVWYRASHLKS